MNAQDREPPFADRAARTILTDVPCRKCGYNLRALDLHGRCPECGQPDNFRSVKPVGHRRNPRPLHPRLSQLALAVSAVSLVPMLGLRALLAMRGLSINHLWGGGNIRPLQPAAQESVGLASSLATIVFPLSAIGIVFCLSLLALALSRRDTRTCLHALAAIILLLAGAYLAIETGFTIAGV